MVASAGARSDEARGGVAVVVGGSMAGLPTARVLTEHFERVVLAERDVLPEGVEHRKGVPQGHHLHALLGRGARALATLFPGLEEELVAAGAIVGDIGADGRYFQMGDTRPAAGAAYAGSR